MKESAEISGMLSAQDNNHGTSEAAGLFIGGSWLATVDRNRYNQAQGYAEKGRKWLEERVKKLVAADGSFSQHSVNYHRVAAGHSDHLQSTLERDQVRNHSVLFFMIGLKLLLTGFIR
ncbi:MAG: hypothetical protein MZU84_04970 [Sphingobacterium sp.]|nr:hypothetical protein [Sphingobacterium sp.]